MNEFESLIMAGIPWKRGMNYTRHCTFCHKDNGRTVTDGPPPENTPGRCVYCGSANTRWKLIAPIRDK